MTEPLYRSMLAEAPAATAADHAYCRDMLPRVSRTFAINIRVLGGSMGEAVRVAYLLCRAADALEDSWPGEPAVIADHFDLFLAAMAGDSLAARELAQSAAVLAPGRDDLALVAELPRVLAVYDTFDPADRDAIREGVGIMARGMKRYAVRAAVRERVGVGGSVTAAGSRGLAASPGVVTPDGSPEASTTGGRETLPYLDDEGELHDYCWVVAGCVGVMLTRLFSRRAPANSLAIEARRFELAPVVGEALQLTNILLDWPSDLRRGRCHVPAAWLAERSLTPRDLTGAASPGARALAARLETLARAALARVPDYLDTIPARHLRYRQFCLWPALWALASLRHARRDPEFPCGPSRPRLPRATIWRTAVASVFTGHGGGGVRALCAMAGGTV